MGLLDSMQQAPQQPQGGLLGGMMAEGAAPAPTQPQGGGQELQLAMQLAQSPTPQTAQAIIAQMRQAQMPGADEMALANLAFAQPAARIGLSSVESIGRSSRKRHHLFR